MDTRWCDLGLKTWRTAAVSMRTMAVEPSPTQSSLVFYHAICKCCNIDGYLPKPDERKRSRQVERSDGIHTELTFRLTYRIVHHTLIAACMKDPMQWVTDKRSKIALPLFVTTNWLPWDTISLSKPVSIHHGFAKVTFTPTPT
eukprot:5803310-Pyramimonas_sp.AAC.1